MYCHNCGSSLKAFNWVKEVSGATNQEIIDEVKDYDVSIDIGKDEEVKTTVQVSTLPDDSINFSDTFQLDYYSDNNVVTACKHIRF